MSRCSRHKDNRHASVDAIKAADLIVLSLDYNNELRVGADMEHWVASNRPKVMIDHQR